MPSNVANIGGVFGVSGLACPMRQEWSNSSGQDTRMT